MLCHHLQEVLSEIQEGCTTSAVKSKEVESNPGGVPYKQCNHRTDVKN